MCFSFYFYFSICNQSSPSGQSHLYYLHSNVKLSVMKMQWMFLGDFILYTGNELLIHWLWFISQLVLKNTLTDI